MKSVEQRFAELNAIKTGNKPQKVESVNSNPEKEINLTEAENEVYKELNVLSDSELIALEKEEAWVLTLSQSDKALYDLGVISYEQDKN